MSRPQAGAVPPLQVAMVSVWQTIWPPQSESTVHGAGAQAIRVASGATSATPAAPPAAGAGQSGPAHPGSALGTDVFWHVVPVGQSLLAVQV
jgi:hypothetical protein